MDDLVSRQKVLRCIKESRENIDWGQSEDGDAFLHYSTALYRTIASKECLPSAQPERKKGRWEYETMRHLITGEMRTVRICSVCDGGWFRYDMSDGVEDAEPNYCPNCGADMRGEEDEDKRHNL